ncbi:MAG TPA: TonB-dependent receptor [bacterium]|nr:TonB-dependent receptor [bacterium]HPN46220.1 TonB-dependent receptor [bacterium]
MKRCALYFRYFICLLAICLLSQNTIAQNIKGTIRGNVVDKITRHPLPGANIVILNTSPTLGAAYNDQGDFIIKNVPIGRYNIKVTFIGYEAMVYPEIVVGSGKAAVLNAELMFSPVMTDELVVSATTAKEKPINEMVQVSGRRFSVEEARRYAGGLDDPGRLSSSFAGVTTGLTEDNGIVVRGNAPKGILWRLEGIEITNPNHFFDLTTLGGGGATAMSSMMLDNSDFLTGAFPAEYSNALSGVFDMKLKTGNSENYEHTFQVGFMGIDMASEGPLFRNNNSSYAFNYRYSTLGLVRHLMTDKINIPTYQDLAFKINYPTLKVGTFSLWGVGFIDDIAKKADEDTTTWEYADDREEYQADLNMGVIGLTHKLIIGQNSFVNSTLAYTSRGMTFDDWTINFKQNKKSQEFIDSRLGNYVFSTNLYHKWNSRHFNKTGFSVYNMFYNMNIKTDLDNTGPLDQIVLENGKSNLLQGYSQSNFRINEQWTLIAGLNYQYFTLNNNSSLEPRASISWDFMPNQTISFGAGTYSRLEILNIYMAQQQSAGKIIKPNKDLDFTKARHYVLGYNFNLSENTYLKIEPYYQQLYNVPVIPDSSYSLLNLEDDWYFNKKLVNTGSGTNVGIDFTLERYLQNHYYYLMTTSLFQSKYKGDDGIERNSRYNRNYVINILGGKEWITGKSKNNLLGVNLRFQLIGGKRITPLDYQRSKQAHNIIYDETNVFTDQEELGYHTHITITYTINKPGYTSKWALQLFNFPSSPDSYGYNYNIKTGKIDKDNKRIFFPVLSYKIEF